MIFVDTNYFLRYLLQDDPRQYNVAKQLFVDAASGQKQLITSTIVLFEIFWVLKSYYNMEKALIIVTIRNILKLQFITLDDRSILEKALGYFAKTNLSLEDCYNIAYAKSKVAKVFKTFDVKLEKEFKKKTN
ncbi:PIN domain-containing protein [Candidatus Daviesbacteria bacterium]|nr:PIN domain-containing protein [Candidatus Daviesbacteria bacterium]